LSYNSLLFRQLKPTFLFSKLENGYRKRYAIEIEEFGKRLRQIREGRGLSQLDLELRCGLNRTEISRIENGHKNIEFFTIVKLA